MTPLDDDPLSARQLAHLNFRDRQGHTTIGHQLRT
jgi:hypothetical protein